jgi:hypothetical protein
LFNNNSGDEANFCEAYKSQILNNGSREEKPSNTFSKILTILLLLIIIVAVSIYGYIYITDNVNTPPSSVQMIDDNDLIVMDEDEEEPIGIMPPSIEELDIDKIAKDVKLAIEEKGDNSKKVEKKEEKSKEKIEKPLKVPTGNAQSAYLEELAKLSEEIDKERK